MLKEKLFNWKNDIKSVYDIYGEINENFDIKEIIHKKENKFISQKKDEDLKEEEILKKKKKIINIDSFFNTFELFSYESSTFILINGIYLYYFISDESNISNITITNKIKSLFNNFNRRYYIHNKDINKMINVIDINGDEDLVKNVSIDKYLYDVVYNHFSLDTDKYKKYMIDMVNSYNAISKAFLYTKILENDILNDEINSKMKKIFIKSVFLNYEEDYDTFMQIIYRYLLKSYEVNYISLEKIRLLFEIRKNLPNIKNIFTMIINGYIKKIINGEPNIENS